MSAERSETRWVSYAGALFATTIWGLTFVALPVALTGFAPLQIVWIRNVLGAALLFGVLKARGGPLLPQREDRPRCALLGVIFGAHLLVQTFAMQRTTADRAGWVIACIPAVVALGSRLFLGRRMRVLGWAGVATASCGVAVLMATKASALIDVGAGDWMVLSTCFSWAAYTLLSVGPMERNGALRVTAFAMIVSALPNLVAALALPAAALAPDARSIAALVFLGVFASALATWAFNVAVVAIGPTRGASFQYLQPFVTSAGAFFYLHEVPTRGVLLGGPIVLAGVWMIQRGRRAI
jgi:drug/metabolite transporter (DMT)-like permease